MKKVIKWVTLDVIQKSFTGYDGCYWPLHRPARTNTEKEFNNCFDGIMKELIDNDYVIYGDTYQNGCVPIFDDFSYFDVSMRKWGEIMADAFNIKHNTHYTYKDFYLISFGSEEEKLPPISNEITKDKDC